MARDYEYYFAQLRRIEDHREEKAVKEIRKIYKEILKETKHFIAEEYYNLAEDGKLTFEILRSKGQDARFLQEVENRLGDVSLDVSKEIRQTVEEMYQLAYDGIRDAVQKGSDTSFFFEGIDSSTAQTMRATVDNTIMEIALEKNHKDIVWDIKREVARSLMVGDRFEAMAHRIADNLNRSYKKAVLITRTEVGRVREAGHLASAKDLNETLKQGSSGMQMVKKWKSMRDGRVRDQHVSMNNKVVAMDELFELPDGVKTQAPKQSGAARHDCNCRCLCTFPLMDDAEYFAATGKHFKNTLHSRKEDDKIAADNDIIVGKSLGARAKNYNIELPDKEIVHLTEGTRITHVEVIAGKGRNRAIDEIDGLLAAFPDTRESEWQKKKGIGFVDYDGESYRANLHWYEEPTVGRVKWKVKPDKDGNWFYDD